MFPFYTITIETFDTKLSKIKSSPEGLITLDNIEETFCLRGSDLADDDAGIKAWKELFPNVTMLCRLPVLRKHNV